MYMHIECEFALMLIYAYDDDDDDDDNDADGAWYSTGWTIVLYICILGWYRYGRFCV